jgi:hypothetical protein
MRFRGGTVVRALVGTIIAAGTLAPQAAGSELSNRLQLLSGKDLRSASPAEQAEALSLPTRGPASLLRVGGSVVVDVRVAAPTRDRTAGLRSAGAEVLSVSPRYQTITVAVPERSLRSLGSAPGVLAATEVLTPMTSGAGGDGASASINPCVGSVTSEGDAQLNAGAARTQFDVDGTGIKVGILSDSFDALGGASTDASTGDLPGPGNPCGRTNPVQVLSDVGGADEGRAMAQLVHDLAPGADLAFATAFISETSFANNIRGLANSGAKVIVDDITYFDEPFYQDGIVSNAVNDVTAQGVTYYSSAANNNNRVAAPGVATNSWEAPSFRDGGACPTGVAGIHCMDFDPTGGTDTSYQITVPNGRSPRVELQWAEPWDGVTTNLNLHVTRVSTGLQVASSTSSTTGVGSKPFEILQFTNSTGATATYNIAINNASAAGTPRLKFIVLDNGAQTVTASEYPVSANGDTAGPTIFGHNGAGNAMSSAAVPFNNSATVETFSSRGPLTLLFGPVNSPTPAPPLGSPQTLNKPDIAATDGGLTTFFGSGNRFFGTSAAAPHAAAVAALQLDANPAQTVAQVKNAQKSTAVPVGAFGPEAIGSGLVNALAAVPVNPPAPPTVTITSFTTGDSTPPIPFTVNGNPKTLTCAIDGGAAVGCTSPFTPAAALGDGSHTLAVNVTDYFGGSGSGSGSFTVNTKGPSTKIDKEPKKKSRKRKATFRFSADPGSTFECKLDKDAFKICTSPFKAKVKPGKHTFEVRAVDSFGNAGPAEQYNWKVKKKRR